MWSEYYLHPRVLGFRPGTDVQKIGLHRSLALEEAILAGRPTYLATFDLMKAYDHVPHEPLFALLTHLQMPMEVLSLLRAHLGGQRQRWKLHGCISGVRRMTRGLLQGCALSCMAFNIIINPMIWQIAQDDVASPTDAYADDITTVGSTLGGGATIHKSHVGISEHHSDPHPRRENPDATSLL